MSTYGKLNLLLINSIYLVFSSLEMESRLMQAKLHCKFFYSVWIETTHKPSNVAAAKGFYVAGTTYFDECF